MKYSTIHKTNMTHDQTSKRCENIFQWLLVEQWLIILALKPPNLEMLSHLKIYTILYLFIKYIEFNDRALYINSNLCSIVFHKNTAGSSLYYSCNSWNIVWKSYTDTASPQNLPENVFNSSTIISITPQPWMTFKI